MDKNGILPYTLSSCIHETLKNHEIHSEFSNALLTPDKTHVKHKNETELWDYKEDVDFENTEELAKLSSRVLAFHNNKGGCLIFGIRKDYVVSGFYKTKLIDSVTLKNKLKRYIGNTVNIFQDQITLPINGKVIFILFIPKRIGQPISVHSNGPENKGVPVVKRGDYYIRIGDETKVCREPADFDRLFLDASFKHISAYQYEIDIPYFRLLAPHHRRLIGREKNIADIISALNSRHFIISLDGVGGVGKSALAIETLRKIYANGTNGKYQFIISASAKNKVWHNRIETRQAGFSGLAELIEIFAEVLDVDTAAKTIEELKSDVVNLMKGVEGIIFLDNLEEINDNSVWQFLKDDVPEPVKILVTSRTKRDIGARSIPVPGMSVEDARSLFYEELEFLNYHKYYEEQAEVEEILNSTGYLPLAIKWAASMIIPCKSLKNVSSEFRKASVAKKSFLDFCYSTMFDSLSVIARETALCVPFLSNNTNSSNIALLLQKRRDEIDDSMNELEDKGLIFFHNDVSKQTFFVLPLTMDFLSEKLNQNGNFRKRLIRVSAENEGIHLPKNQQIEVYYQRATILENNNTDLDKASELVHAALQTINKEKIDVNPRLHQSLKFLDGKIFYKLKEYNKGIARMSMAISRENEAYFTPDDFIYLSQALFCHGSGRDELGLNLFAKYYAKSPITTVELIEDFLSRIKNSKTQDNLMLFLNNLPSSNPKFAHCFVNYMWDSIQNKQFTLIIGDELIEILKSAASFEDVSTEQSKQFTSKASELHELFKSLNVRE